MRRERRSHGVVGQRVVSSGMRQQCRFVSHRGVGRSVDVQVLNIVNALNVMRVNKNLI